MPAKTSSRSARARAEKPGALCMALLLLLVLGGAPPSAQSAPRAELAKSFYKDGNETLEAFAPLSRAVRDSVVKFDLDGNTVALGAIVSESGLAVTKASELKNGKLTCWLANGTEVSAEVLAVDEDNDLALARIRAKGLKPVRWAVDEVSTGQWVATQGIAETPQAVGIVSASPRRILPRRAFIGVQLDRRPGAARIEQIMKGLGAEKAGLKSGDQILAVNDTPVSSADELTKMLRSFREGQTVKVRVQRETEEFDAPIELRTPASDGPASSFNRADRMDRMGSELSGRAEGFDRVIQHDTVLEAWQCGGPLVNLEGRAVGVNIARAGRVASYALAAEVVRRSVEKLSKKAGIK